jgi:hypothetical protein
MKTELLNDSCKEILEKILDRLECTELNFFTGYRRYLSERMIFEIIVPLEDAFWMRWDVMSTKEMNSISNKSFEGYMTKEFLESESLPKYLEKEGRNLGQVGIRTPERFSNHYKNYGTGKITEPGEYSIILETLDGGRVILDELNIDPIFIEDNKINLGFEGVYEVEVPQHLLKYPEIRVWKIPEDTIFKKNFDYRTRYRVYSWDYTNRERISPWGGRLVAKEF